MILTSLDPAIGVDLGIGPGIRVGLLMGPEIGLGIGMDPGIEMDPGAGVGPGLLELGVPVLYETIKEYKCEFDAE